MEEEDTTAARPWADLLPDLLRDVSGGLRDAADFVRFHAVCGTWRDTLPATPSHYPPLLPWLVAPCSDLQPSITQFRSIFSKTTWRVSGTYCRGNRWLGTEDGKSIWLITAGGSSSPRLIDPFTGAATTLPPFPDKIREYFLCTDGIVCSDGTVALYAVANFDKYFCYILAAVLRPGDAAWTEGQTYLIYNGFEERCAAAYHRGSIVLVDLYRMYIVKIHLARGGNSNGHLVEVIDTTKDDYDLQPVARRSSQSIYVLESRGELLAAVLQTTEEDGSYEDSRDLAAAMSVQIYALESETVDGKAAQQWVRRDSRSLLNDRVLFLGCPTSFAVDAARFPEDYAAGGCAYFVLNSANAGWTWRKVPKASRVYRYSFKDGSTMIVEELPGWKADKAMMWIVPNHFAIAPAHEIRGRLLRQHTSSKQGAPCPSSIIRRGRELSLPFKIFVGNLPSWANSFRLRQFFQNYGDVTDERVIHDTRSGHSWGYGFVTMETFEEPAEVFAALDGENFYGQVLQVKKFDGERPKGPFVMMLLAQNKKA